MGDIQLKIQPKMYNVVIVGSGSGGGMAAYVLPKAGLKVCIPEAGAWYDPQKNITLLKLSIENYSRGFDNKPNNNFKLTA
jgi:choline dehydrogenase-like flavoprotein